MGVTRGCCYSPSKQVNDLQDYEECPNASLYYRDGALMFLVSCNRPEVFRASSTELTSRFSFKILLLFFPCILVKVVVFV